MPENEQPIYQSFLVRCWFVAPASAGKAPVWRFELRDVSAEPQKQRFSDLEQLKNFVATELDAIAAGNEQGSDGEDGRKGEERWHGE